MNRIGKCRLSIADLMTMYESNGFFFFKFLMVTKLVCFFVSHISVNRFNFELTVQMIYYCGWSIINKFLHIAVCTSVSRFHRNVSENFRNREEKKKNCWKWTEIALLRRIKNIYKKCSSNIRQDRLAKQVFRLTSINLQKQFLKNPVFKSTIFF